MNAAEIIRRDAAVLAAAIAAGGGGGGGGSGTPLIIQDENTNVALDVTQIDFQGAGVTVTPGTGEIVVTIPGGGGGGGGGPVAAVDVSVVPTGLIVVTTTNVQSALEQLDAAVGLGSSPTGAAGGDLTGTYPNPSIGAAKILNAHVSGSAAIAESKLALDLPTSLVGGLVKLGEVTLGTAATSIDFSLIPATYLHLSIVARLRTDRATFIDEARIAFNNDTVSSNYDRQIAYTTAATTAALEALGSGGGATRNIGFSTATTSLAGSFGLFDIVIPDYASVSKTKVVRTQNYAHMVRTTGGSIIAQTMNGWVQTTAINRVTLTPVTGPNFVAGSSASLYGIRSAA